MAAQDRTVVVKLRFAADAADVQRQMQQLARATAQAAAAQDKLNGARKSARSADTYGLRGDFVGRNDTYRLAPAGAAAGGGAAAGLPAWMQAARARDQANRDRVLGSLAAQRQSEERRDRVLGGLSAQRAAAEAEARRQHVLGSLGAQRQQELAHHAAVGRYDDLAGDLRAGYADRIKTARELHARGLNADGSPMVGLDSLFNRPPGERGRLDSVSPFLGRLAGRAALPLAVAYAGKEAAEAYNQIGRAQASPFLRAGASAEAGYTAIPFFGSFASTGLEARRQYTGERAQLTAIEERRQEQGLRGQLTGQANLQRDELLRGAASAQTRAEAFAGLRLDRLPAGLDRNTVGGARAYEDAKQLLPLQQRLTVATKERAAAEKDFGRLQAEEVKKQKELEAIDRRLNEARQRRQAAAGRDSRQVGATEEYEQASRAEADINKEKENKQAELDAARSARKAGEGTAVEARAAERSAAADIARQQLAQAEGRENEARAGARTLGGLGRAGRQEAKVALQMVQRLGADNVDPETLALAEQVAPDTVSKLKERAGEAAKGQFRDLAPDERRLADTGKAAAETDRAREKVTQLEEGGLSAEARERGEAAARGLFEEITALYKTLEAKLKQFRADRERGAGNGA